MPAPRPIVVIGSLNNDFVYRVPRLPAAGETVVSPGMTRFPGGKGANQAVAAARLDAPVSMVGRVGDDPFGATLLEELAAEAVDTKHVRVTPGIGSGAAVILVDDRGENSIVVSPGANARVTPADVDAAAPLIRTASVVLLQLEIPLATVRHTIVTCRRLGVPTILDPAPVPHRGLPRALFGADYLTPNEVESIQIAGLKPARAGRGPDPDAIGRALRARGARSVILKLGARGSAIASRDGKVKTVRPFRVRVTDTTAAGDAFNGAFAVALAEGKGLEDAARFANAAGALCCTRLGAQPALPTRRAVERMVRGR